MYWRLLSLSVLLSLGFLTSCSARRAPEDLEYADYEDELAYEDEYEDEDIELESYEDGSYPQAPNAPFDPRVAGMNQPYGWPYYQPGPNGYAPLYPPNYQQPGYPYSPPYLPQTPPTVYTAAIGELYRSVLSREPDEAGREFWIREILAGRPFTKIREEFLKGPEAISTGDVTGRIDIIAYYRLYLGRTPTFAEIQGLQGVRSGTNGLQTLAQQFENSQEYLTQVGKGRFFSKPLVEAFKAINGIIPDVNLLTPEVNRFRSGFSYASYFAPLVYITPVQTPVVYNPITFDAIRANCIAAFRVVRGVLPSQADLQACVARGDNTVTISPNNYNATLQQYIQFLFSAPRLY
jgi:hypothetical protein